MKKTLSMLLAFSMLLGLLTTTAFAAKDTAHTITITNPANTYVYEAYQVFKGDLSEKTLSNVEWGAGVDGEALLAELIKLEAYKDCKTASDVAEVLAGFNDNSDSLEAFAAVVATKLKVVAGTSTVSASATEGKYSYTINVTGDGYYFVKDQANSITGAESYTKYMLQVVKDITVESKSDVPTFQKKIKDTNDSVANSTTDWQDSADYDIGDDVPFQLTGMVAANYDDYTTYKFVFHDKESIGLTFNNDVKVYVDGVEITTGYEVVTEGLTDGCTFEVRFADLKDITAVKAGSVITVEYTSKLNEKAVIGSAGNPNEARLEFSNNPNASGEGDTDNTGMTPWDKVIVFTYKTVINKVDEQGEALPGAGFTLYKKNAEGNYVAIGGELTGDDMTTFEWKGLDDGNYKLSETTTPAGYNTIADIEFTISATHEETADDPKLLTLTGGDKFTGEVDTNQKLTGTLKGDVVNQTGSVLPETGGIGTTIFYVLGGLMAVGAGVLLVAKKRMDA